MALLRRRHIFSARRVAHVNDSPCSRGPAPLSDPKARPLREGRPLLYLERKVAQPLMPHATAAWMVDNTSLTFEQIAEFCGLHILEVQAIADDTAATKLTGRDPIRAGELTHEEIEKGQKDANYQLQMHKAPDPVRRTRGPRYTPVSKRQDKPDGIA